MTVDEPICGEGTEVGPSIIVTISCLETNYWKFMIEAVLMEAAEKRAFSVVGEADSSVCKNCSHLLWTVLLCLS